MCIQEKDDQAFRQIHEGLNGGGFEGDEWEGLPGLGRQGSFELYKRNRFNTLFKTVQSCFPVSFEVIGQEVVYDLFEGFQQIYRAESRFLEDIRKDFAAFLTERIGAELLVEMIDLELTVEAIMRRRPLNVEKEDSVITKSYTLPTYDIWKATLEDDEYTGGFEEAPYVYALWKQADTLQCVKLLKSD